jgi:diacylglycerol O-acyltransferase / wax synthase
VSGVERMTGLDGAFLALESSTTHLHIVGVLVLEPRDETFEATFRRIRALIADRVELVRPFRMRLVAPALGLGHQGLVEDRGVDLDYHVRRAGLPRPGGRRELESLVADIASRPLDRSRPLWEMHLVDGLAGDGVVVVAKVHHAIIDGVAGTEVLATFFDLVPDGVPASVTRLDRRRGSSAGAAPHTDNDGDGWLTGVGTGSGTELDQLRELLASVPGHVDAVLRSIGRTVQRARSTAAQRRVPSTPTATLPLTAPRTSVNRAISAYRRVALGDLAMDDVRRVRDVLGGTTNDVILATVAGSLRSFFARRGEKPDGALVALVPVSVRAGSRRGPPGGSGAGSPVEGALGNQLSALLVTLPTTVDDPVDRLRDVRASAAAAKELDRTGGPDLLAGWAEALVPALASRASQAATDSRLFDRLRPVVNVVVSNVPGPDVPIYLAGSRLRTLYPIGPVVEGVGVNVTVISYLDRIHVGVQACFDLVPDVEVIARGIEDSLAELVRVADRRDRPVPWWHAEVVPA